MSIHWAPLKNIVSELGLAGVCGCVLGLLVAPLFGIILCLISNMPPTLAATNRLCCLRNRFPLFWFISHNLVFKWLIIPFHNSVCLNWLFVVGVVVDAPAAPLINELDSNVALTTFEFIKSFTLYLVVRNNSQFFLQWDLADKLNNKYRQYKYIYTNIRKVKIWIYEESNRCLTSHRHHKYVK